MSLKRYTPAHGGEQQKHEHLMIRQKENEVHISVATAMSLTKLFDILAEAKNLSFLCDNLVLAPRKLLSNPRATCRNNSRDPLGKEAGNKL